MKCKDVTITVECEGRVAEVTLPLKSTLAELVTRLPGQWDLPLCNTGGSLVKYCLANQDRSFEAYNGAVFGAGGGRLPSFTSTLLDAGISPGDRLALSRAIFGGCFPEDAPVLIPSGDTVPIGKLSKGDNVLAYDAGVRTYTATTVGAVCREDYSELVVVNETFHTTADQTVLLSDGRWKLAGQLEKGDRLIRYPFAWTDVAKVERQSGNTPVVSLALPELLCFVCNGFIVRDYVGKQFGKNFVFDREDDCVYVGRKLDVFLSYSRQDRQYARLLASMNAEARVDIFFAEDAIAPGRQWESLVKAALRACRQLWVLVTPRSLTSEWVISEWSAAWLLNKTIIPILVECSSADLPPRLQRFQCIDFSEAEQLFSAFSRSKGEGGQSALSR